MPDLKINPSATLRTGVLYYGDNLDILRSVAENLGGRDD